MPEITLVMLVVYAVATYRLTIFFTEDEIISPLRDRLFDRFPPESTRTGYLFTCDWCMSIWTASLLLALYMIIPIPAALLMLVLFASGVTGYVSTRLG